MSNINPVWCEWITRHAENNIAKWGVQEFETLGLAVCEEAGELAQAILKNKHENGSRVEISREAIDLAALCLQVLVTMNTKHGAENVLTFMKKMAEEMAHSPDCAVALSARHKCSCGKAQ